MFIKGKYVKRIIGLLMAVLITGYLFIHLSYMCRGYTRLMGYYGLENNTIDVIFVGTSVTFSSFMPMEAWNQYGMASFDYCTNVQFLSTLRYSIREIQKTQNPKLIMIDIAPFMYDHYVGNKIWSEEQKELYIKYNIDSMKYSCNRVQLVKEINDEQAGNFFDYMYYFFDISRYHTHIPSIKQFNNSFHEVEHGYGYLEKNGGAIIKIAELVEDNGDLLPLEGKQDEYLQKLIKETQKLNCNVVYYCAPVVFEEPESFMRKNYIKQVLGEANCVFWDFSSDIKEIDLDYTLDFWSCNHLDSLGAEKATLYIAKKIKENYNIPDRRGDSKYKLWNADYEKWLDLKASYNEKDLNK